MVAYAFALSLMVLLPLSAATQPDNQQDEKLLGTWVAVEGEYQGVPMARDAIKDIKWTFTPEKVMYTELGRAMEGSYTFQPTTNPASFDFKGSASAIQGIYQLNGDTLKVCFAATQRPNEFKTGGTSQDTLLFVFKRMPR